MTKSPIALSEIIKSKPVPQKVNNKTISHSQFTVYNNCAHQWYLRYVLKNKPFTGSINTVFGTAMHETLQEFLERMYTVSAKSADDMDLETLLQERFQFNYAKERGESNSGIDFSNLEEIEEFFEDGIAILRWFKSHRGEFFSIKGYKLLGIEIPIMQPALANRNVFFNGFIDFVLFDESTGKIIVYDIKTSARGWKDDREKKDKTKIAQILWYKKFFAAQYEVPEEDIEVVFFILKRKIYENSDWPQPRVQVFRPACGSAKSNEAAQFMKNFVNECFTPEGDYNINREFKKNPGKACTYCPFKENELLCDQRQS